MKIPAKIVSVINIIYLFVILYNLVYGAAILGIVGTLIGVLVLLSPIILGLINSILFYRKSRKNKVKSSKLDHLFALAPILNTALVLVLVLSLIFLS